MATQYSAAEEALFQRGWANAAANQQMERETRNVTAARARTANDEAQRRQEINVRADQIEHAQFGMLGQGVVGMGKAALNLIPKTINGAIWLDQKGMAAYELSQGNLDLATAINATPSPKVPMWFGYDNAYQAGAAQGLDTVVAVASLGDGALTFASKVPELISGARGLIETGFSLLRGGEIADTLPAISGDASVNIGGIGVEVADSAPASSAVRFVSDSNLFLDRPVAAGNMNARALFDDVLAHPDTRMVLPDLVEAEITPTESQLGRLSDAASKIERTSVDVESLLSENPTILSRRFGVEDLQLLEAARQNGLAVVTSNSALASQVASNAARAAIFGNVPILVPFTSFNTAEELVGLLRFGSH